jgi:thioesterase domain-containing protein
MDLRQLQAYLHEHIPLSLAMQVSVLEVAPEHLVLGAPLKPNINHRETVFGGSASALCILSAWALLHTRIVASGFQCTLVIQHNTMSYERAVTGDFSARATVPSIEKWQAFTRMLERKGRSRITVSSTLLQAGYSVGRFEGDFVALTSKGAMDRRSAA